VQKGSAEVAALLAEEIAAGRWAEGASVPGIRVRAREAGCSAGTVARAYGALRDAGVLSGAPRARFVVARGGQAAATRWGTGVGALRLAGSDDPALDLLIREVGRSVSVAPGPRGSVHGLAGLARGTADAAAVHLLDATRGRWNDHLARGALAGEPVRIVHLWKRDQGLVLPPGNPNRIHAVMWSGGCDPTPELGVMADSHLGVAAAVASGAAEVGLAVRAVAESAGLDWVAVVSEPFELALATGSEHAAEPLLDRLASSALQRRLAALPGYDLSMSGHRRIAA
jgi:molybdate-binding protein